MATVKDTRRHNLMALLARADSQAEFARSLEVDPAYISQLVTGVREVGDKTARKIERLKGEPTGWMDVPHSPLPALVGNEPAAVKIAQIVSQASAPVTTVSIPLLEIEASMGITGRVQPEYETIIGHIELNEHFVRTHLPNASSPKNIRVITGYGDSMQGTYEDGDPLFVDVGITELKVDATYCFALNGEFYVKRLQRMPDGSIKIKSDNERYDDIVIPAPERSTLRVIARVLGAWNWRRL